jgi:hypothetical protein
MKICKVCGKSFVKTKDELKGTIAELVSLMTATTGMSNYYRKEWIEICMKLLKLELKCRKRMM